MRDLLLVEDDARLAELLRKLLIAEGHRVDVVARGDTAVDRILERRPDLVVLDVGLPGLSGFEVCARVRPAYTGRILVLTARGDLQDELRGFEVGADDYLSKPFAPERLLARVAAQLRRVVPPTETLVNGALVVDLGTREARLDGQLLELSTVELDMLVHLLQHRGRVLSRDSLSQALRGFPHDGIDRTLDIRISRLRKVLGDAPRKPTWIKTVHGAGYLMVRR